MNQIMPEADFGRSTKAPASKALHFIQCLDIEERMVWLNPATIAAVEIAQRHHPKFTNGKGWMACVVTSGGNQYLFRVEQFQEATKEFFPSDELGA